MDVAELERRAAEAEAMAKAARADFVWAVREADAAGLSQREIARAVGRSQPEVRRLIKFHGTSAGGKALRRARGDVIDILGRAHLSHPRVFGSVAREEDGPESDVDLLVTGDAPIGLMALARVERQLSDVVGRPVDLVVDTGIRPDLADAILAEAVAL